MTAMRERFTKGQAAQWYDPRKKVWVDGVITETDPREKTVSFEFDKEAAEGTDYTEPDQVPGIFVRHVPEDRGPGHFPEVTIPMNNLVQMHVTFAHPDTISDEFAIRLRDSGVTNDHSNEANVLLKHVQNGDHIEVIPSVSWPIYQELFDRRCSVDCEDEDCGSAVQTKWMQSVVTFAHASAIFVLEEIENVGTFRNAIYSLHTRIVEQSHQNYEQVGEVIAVKSMKAMLAQVAPISVLERLLARGGR